MTDFTRRDLLIGSDAILAVGALPDAVLAARGTAKSSRFASSSGTQGEHGDNHNERRHDYLLQRWGKGQPIVFSHGWPLSADDWDTQMMFFLNHGYRVIAYDPRGHGRSSQTGEGHDMDHYADDLAALTAHLDLKNAMDEYGVR